LVEDKTFFFRKSGEDKAEDFTFNFGLDLHSFSINMKVVPQENKFESRSWDVKNKKEIAYTAEGAPTSAKMEMYPSKGSNVSASLLDEVAVDAADAEKLAKAKYDSVLKDVITGEGKCCGNPNVRTGKTIKIEGIGERLSGKYYVTSSVHTVNDEGYTSTFKVRKVMK
ncbi:MAG: hypothetical protein OEW04_15695, partial [Nitrospirota bacterium]|nr:hypothetical protein [Nitrospirota bacterium]